MRPLRIFIHSLLLASTPPFLAYPHELSLIQQAEHEEEQRLSSYDQVLNYLEQIESGTLENASPEDIERATQFVALLATKGILPNDTDEEDLEDDIQELCEETNITFAYHLGDGTPLVVPALYSNDAEFILCKSWIKKKCKQIGKFVKKHKKEILIGAAVVVAVAAVVVASVAVASAAGAAGAAAAAPDKSDHSKEPSISDSIVPSQEAPILANTIDEHISSFKDNLVKEEFFRPLDKKELSWEESGRALGSLFAHESFKNLNNELAQHPSLLQEVQTLGIRHQFVPKKASVTANDFAHPEIDRHFSTNYTPFYLPNTQTDFTALSYQVHGERALKFGHYEQAVYDLGKSIHLDPTQPLPYLERSVAYFGLGQYDRSLEDYRQYNKEQTIILHALPEFSFGFAKGLPKGMYDSGEGFLLFLGDLVTHPIQTSEHVMDACLLLSNLVRSGEWENLSQFIAPEVYQLFKDWHTLEPEKCGELAGYAFGKYGADILIPGTLAKAVAKGVKGAKELNMVHRSLQTAEKTLLLESVAQLENGANIAEAIQTSRTTLALGEEVGLTTREMGELKQVGQLETTVKNTFEHLNPAMQESITLHKRAREILKPHAKQPMPELRVRELIHETGIPTFPRPKDIPNDFLVMVSDRGAGMEYVHPTNTHIRIRVMPGKPHSPNPSQQRPYVIQQKSGKAFDKHGNLVSPEKPEAHIPFEEFIYRE